LFLYSPFLGITVEHGVVVQPRLLVSCSELHTTWFSQALLY
jgi:hypothetical protein